MSIKRIGIVTTTFASLFAANACGSWTTTTETAAPLGQDAGTVPSTNSPIDAGPLPGDDASRPSRDAGTIAPVTAFLCSHVASMATDTLTYTNWMGAWFGVTSGTEGERFGSLLPYDEPNTPVVETQYYYDEARSSSASVLAIGPSNAGDVPEQILTLTTDQGPLAVYMPALRPDDCVRTRLYVAADGSTYHSRADHDYTYSPAKANTPGQCFDARAVVGPDLTPTQAFVPEHLARAAPGR